MKTILDFDKEPSQDSIICIATMYNERDSLNYFIEYYVKMGVSHFIFIDNDSSDDSVDIINKHIGNTELKIIYTDESYADNDFGMVWVNNIMKEYKDHWLLVIDLDEYVILKDNQTLIDLRSEMINKNQNASQFCLIDFYPAENYMQSILPDGIDPFKHSTNYDNCNEENYYFTDVARDKSLVIKGGFRQRHFKGEKATNSSYCLHKKSFFKFDFHESHRLSVGMHWLFPHAFKSWKFRSWNKYNKFISYNENVNILAHFKFVKRDFEKYLEKRIERNQDWNQSNEYKTYEFNVSEFYSETYSEEFKDNNKLYFDTIDKLFKKT